MCSVYVTELSDDLLSRLARRELSESQAADTGESYLRSMGRGQRRDTSRSARAPNARPNLSEDEITGQISDDLAGLAEQVRERLPWRSLSDGTPVQMDVVAVGLSELDDSIDTEHRPCSPYVTVVVESFDAADAVQIALEDIAGLDEAEWATGWIRSDHGFREIDIYPSLSL